MNFVLFVADDADFARVMREQTSTVRNPSTGERSEVSFVSVDPDVIDTLPNWQIEDPELFVHLVTKRFGLTDVGEIESLGDAEDMLRLPVEVRDAVAQGTAADLGGLDIAPSMRADANLFVWVDA
jgi:hypothetical protein